MKSYLWRKILIAATYLSTNIRAYFSILSSICLLFISFSSHATEIDKIQKPHIKSEHPLPIKGNLTSVGSDTLSNLMTQWSNLLKQQYPHVNIQIQTLGSSSAVPALIESTAQFGAMSRKMRSNEIKAFERRYGYPPTAIKVAIDAMAIFVHQDNPLKQIELTQVDAIFSRTLRCGNVKPIRQWGDLGLKGSWQSRPITLFGRNSVSGTYGFFKQAALCNGDFRSQVNEQPSSASIVQSVGNSLGAIGYAGVGRQISSVKILPIHEGGVNLYPTLTNIMTHKYPLSRYLYLYVNKHPLKPLPSLEAEFVRLVLSKKGQALVLQDGFVPLPSAVIDAQLKQFQL